MDRHGYADDNQLYTAIQLFRNAAAVLDKCAKLEVCLLAIQDWLTANFLKGNPSETEIALCGTPQRLRALGLESLSIAGINVHVADGPVRNLGVLFDSSLSLASHVRAVVSSANYHLRNVALARHLLTNKATRTLTQAMVVSRLDYCNSLLLGVSEELADKLQVVQNNAARLITRTSRRNHISPVLEDLHWLPVRARIEFKVLTLVYKAVNGIAPDYLQDLLQLYTPSRSLRSSDKNLLSVPRSKTTSFGRRAFSFLAPQLWNSLSCNLRDTQSLLAFRNTLKTVLFQKYFAR
ncbi:uncharacterized protein LOC135502611 [Lineus longissimus]|uniref:uncharacterized protein LOC135502611 n=1 Tax=Lineus longissimus TaxID=88925 RepID=UPI00315CE0EA